MKGTRESHRRLRCIFLHELQLHFVLRREGALAQLVQSQLKETIALHILHDEILTRYHIERGAQTRLQDPRNPSIPSSRRQRPASRPPHQRRPSLSKMAQERRNPTSSHQNAQRLQICGSRQI